ncbi:MAG TPA: hypothetical protein VJ278_03725 [Chthoniobacterales bacterium]|nr:hypothetical protein [Chthoniobacterales bacterium]
MVATAHAIINDERHDNGAGRALTISNVLRPTLWSCVAQESYRLIHRMDTLLSAHGESARHQANPTGVVLAGLFEEIRVKRRVLPGNIYFHE